MKVRLFFTGVLIILSLAGGLALQPKRGEAALFYYCLCGPDFFNGLWGCGVESPQLGPEAVPPAAVQNIGLNFSEGHAITRLNAGIDPQADIGAFPIIFSDKMRLLRHLSEQIFVDSCLQVPEACSIVIDSTCRP